MIEGNRFLNLSAKRVLYLTKDTSLIERQLAGEDLGPFSRSELLDRVSTDTYPTRSCFRYDNSFLGSQAFTGLKLDTDRWIKPDSVRRGNFGVLVAGNSFGCGSSREHFPLSLKAAGIELIIAESIERICAQNCQNIGLPYLEKDKTNRLYQLIAGKAISMRDVVEKLDPISAEIVYRGGLFDYFRYYSANHNLPKPDTSYRPMTGVEKIIARHMGVSFVKPGDSGFVEADIRYSYEIFLPLSYHLLKENMPDADIKNPENVYLFYDHSVLDNSLDAALLVNDMRKIAKKEGLKLYDGNRLKGAEGICHTVMLDRHTLPGQVILGTDSHTCTLGAVGALPIGIGATEWAAALWTNKVRVSVPHSVRFDLQGRFNQGVMAKDVMLYILSRPYVKDGDGIGKIFEFAGEGLNNMSFDEQVVLANMAVEGGAFSSFVAPNKNSVKFLQDRHSLSLHAINNLLVPSDNNAQFYNEYYINLTKVEPYVALPGDPRNGIPISELLSRSDIDTHINKAYIGSCAGSKYEDLYFAAQVLEGNKVHKDVELFVQSSSREVYAQAVNEGLIDIIQQAGGIILPPGCGACVNFGPGSFEKGQVGISTTNRNFPGRMGLGDAYLANPQVVAASAIKGRIVTPSMLSS